MSMRILYLLICGIVLAGIVHISIILLIPNYGSKDAWNIISSEIEMWVFRKIANDGETVNALEDTDPYIKMGACTFDLNEAGLKMTGIQSTEFWSVSIFDESGSVVYSLNNDTAINNQLKLLVLNPLQIIALRESPTEDIEQSVIIEADIDKGFAVLRKFESDPSDKDKTDGFLSNAICEKYQ